MCALRLPCARPGKARRERSDGMPTEGIRRGKHISNKPLRFGWAHPIPSMASKRGGRFMEVLYMLGFGQVAYPSNSTPFSSFHRHNKVDATREPLEVSQLPPTWHFAFEKSHFPCFSP